MTGEAGKDETRGVYSQVDTDRLIRECTTKLAMFLIQATIVCVCVEPTNH